MPRFAPVITFTLGLSLLAGGCDRETPPKPPAATSSAAGKSNDDKKAAPGLAGGPHAKTHTPAAITPAVVRTVAVLNAPGRDAVAEPLPTLLLTHLGEQSHLRLVERTRLDVAMKELKMSAAGAGDASAVLQLGKFLGADAFVMLSAGDKSVPGSINLRVVETRGGLLLDEGLVEPALLKPDLRPLISRLLDAFARVPEQHERTRYVGLLDVRSEIAGSSLDATTDEFRTIIGAELRRQPDIFMLERSDLRRLSDEGAMTDLPLALRNASTLLECGVRQDGSTLTVTIRARGLGARTSPEQVLTGLDPNPSASRKQIADALAALLSLAPAAAAGDPASEAAAFAERASALSSFGRHRDAGLAADVALVIDPTFARRRQAYHYWHLAATRNPRFSVAPDGAYRPHDAELLYEAAIRAGRLQLELFADLASTARQPDVPRVGPALSRPNPANSQFGELHLRFAMTHVLDPRQRYPLDDLFDESLALMVDPADADLARLRSQLRELCLARYDRLVRICREHGWPTGDLITQRLSATQTFCQSPQEADRWVDECLQQFATAEARQGLPTTSVTRFYILLSTTFRPAILPYRKLAVPSAARLVDHPDLKTRAVAMSAVLKEIKNDRPRQAAMASSLLDMLWKELPIDEASAEETSFFAAFNAFQGPNQVAIRTLATLDGNAVFAKLSAWITEARQQGDATRLLVLRPLVQEMLTALRSRSTGDHLDALEDALKELPGKPYAEKHREALAANIRNARGTLARKSAPVPSITDDFTITPIPVTGMPATARPVWLAATGDTLLQLTSDSGPYDGVQKWRFWSIPRQGGAAKVLAAGDTAKAMPLGYACLGDRHYFATQAGMLVVADGKIRLLTQVGQLSLLKLTSIAVVDGRLMLGLDSGISWFSPDTQAVETLSSAKALTTRNVLDGGDRYTVESLVADPDRKCVWVGIVDGTRTGVYRWTAADGFHRIADASRYSKGQVVRDGKSILFFTSSALVRYDPEEDQFDVPLKSLSLSGVKGPWVFVNERAYASNGSWSGTKHSWQQRGPVVKIDGRVYWSLDSSLLARKEPLIAEITAGPRPEGR